MPNIAKVIIVDNVSGIETPNILTNANGRTADATPAIIIILKNPRTL